MVSGCMEYPDKIQAKKSAKAFSFHYPFTCEAKVSKVWCNKHRSFGLNHCLNCVTVDLMREGWASDIPYILVWFFCLTFECRYAGIAHQLLLWSRKYRHWRISILTDLKKPWMPLFMKSDFSGSLRPLEYLFGAVYREFRPSIGSLMASWRLK